MRGDGCWSMILLVAGLGFLAGAPAGAQEFPFDQELQLDARPMPNSKRVPSLEVAASGAASISLWCKSGQGQVIVAANTITVIPGPMGEASCTPERIQGDEEMLSGLTQATTWRREGDVIELIGPRTLRFRLMTN